MLSLIGIYRPTPPSRIYHYDDSVKVKDEIVKIKKEKPPKSSEQLEIEIEQTRLLKLHNRFYKPPFRLK